MRVRLIQKDINQLDLHRYLPGPAESAVDLICFPELGATGCLYEPRAVPAVEEIIAPLADCPAAVMFGAARQNEGRLFNTYFYIKDGRYLTYDKVNLFSPFNEDAVYQAGTAPGVFDTDLGHIGVAICYDVRFPDLFAKLKARGVDLVVVPAAFPRIRIEDWRMLLRQRAKETGVPVLGINAVGSDARHEFGGRTAAIDRQGGVVAEAGETGETALDITL